MVRNDVDGDAQWGAQWPLRSARVGPRKRPLQNSETGICRQADSESGICILCTAGQNRGHMQTPSRVSA
eukprot:8745534-Alexandrium_andersonii.AAC.1